MFPLTAKSADEEIEPTLLIVAELESGAARVNGAEIEVGPPRVAEPDTFRYPDVSRPTLL
tara:strand:+ start:463 stop:642 length:180 start_codon:yes stop_codon:yes gene_type:complete